MPNDKVSTIGKVYTSPTGDELVVDVGEYSVGWMRISDTERVEVVRRRIGHHTCEWRPVKGN
jgi:hypothetical protein